MKSVAQKSSIFLSTKRRAVSLAMAPSSPSSRRPRAFLDVAVGSAPSQRLVFELRPDVAPRTCANFLALCSGERRAKTNASGDPLWFQGTAFHRIIPGCVVSEDVKERGN